MTFHIFSQLIKILVLTCSTRKLGDVRTARRSDPPPLAVQLKLYELNTPQDPQHDCQHHHDANQETGNCFPDISAYSIISACLIIDILKHTKFYFNLNFDKFNI